MELVSSSCLAWGPRPLLLSRFTAHTAHFAQAVDGLAFSTGAIHTLGKKSYSSGTPYRACFSAALPGCCNTTVGQGYALSLAPPWFQCPTQCFLHVYPVSSVCLPSHSPTPFYRSCVCGCRRYFPAIWSIPEAQHCNPDLGETDIMETISGNPWFVNNYHW